MNKKKCWKYTADILKVYCNIVTISQTNNPHSKVCHARANKPHDPANNSQTDVSKVVRVSLSGLIFSINRTH